MEEHGEELESKSSPFLGEEASLCSFHPLLHHSMVGDGGGSKRK